MYWLFLPLHAAVCVFTERYSVIDYWFVQTRTNAVVAFDFFVLVLLITLNSTHLKSYN